MANPGTRALILDLSTTHLGVGASRLATGELALSQIFVAFVPVLDRGAAVARIESEVDAQRPLSHDPDLATLSQEIAWAMATKSIGSEEIRRRVRLRTRQRTMIFRATVGSLDAFVAQMVLSDAATRATRGVGIAQGDHPIWGRSAISVVVLLRP